MFTIRPTDVSLTTEPIVGTDKQKATLVMSIPVYTDRINEVFNLITSFDELLQRGADIDTQFRDGTGWDVGLTEDKLGNVVTFKFIL